MDYGLMNLIHIELCLTILSLYKKLGIRKQLLLLFDRKSLYEEGWKPNTLTKDLIYGYEGCLRQPRNLGLYGGRYLPKSERLQEINPILQMAVSLDLLKYDTEDLKMEKKRQAIKNCMQDGDSMGIFHLKPYGLGPSRWPMDRNHKVKNSKKIYRTTVC